MHHWLLNSPIVRLFVIIALGYLVGEIKFPGGFRLGVAGVLFVGLACGAVSPGMELPAEVQTLGLVLFVYCIGLQAAPGFFKSFKRDGLALNLSVLAGLMLALLCAYFALRWCGRTAPLITGVFCGALTSTPALGAVTESIINGGGTAADASLAVVGYGVAYPVAIVLVMLLAQALSVRTRSNEPADAAVSPIPTALTIAVEARGPDGQPWLADIVQRQTGVVLSRQRSPDGRIELVSDVTTLSPGSLVVAVGNPEQLKSAIALLGRVSPISLQQELKGFDVHRYFASKPQAVEKPVGELGLEKLGAVVTRLRRGDIDLPVTHDTRLQLGDRVQVISYKDRERAVREFFGNSLTAFTETGYFSFAVGIIFGLVLGQIPIPIPGLSQPVRLGVAGGPLVVALILGSRGRTGPFIWSVPAGGEPYPPSLGNFVFPRGSRCQSWTRTVDTLANGRLDYSGRFGRRHCDGPPDTACLLTILQPARTGNTARSRLRATDPTRRPHFLRDQSAQRTSEHRLRRHLSAGDDPENHPRPGSAGIGVNLGCLPPS